VTGKLVLENLKHRPMRSLLSILLIAVPVTLILCLIGLSRGLLEDSQNRARGVGADIIVRPSTASSVVGSSAATLPEGLVRKLEEQPHVSMAMGVIVHPIEQPLNIMGIDLEKFNRMSGGFTYRAGGPLRNDDDVLIDRYYAAQRKVGIGDSLKMLNQDWRVAGIIEGGKLARVVVKKTVLQTLDAATGKVSVIYVKCDEPSRTDAVAAQLKELLAGDYKIDKMEEFLAMFNVSGIPGLNAFISVIVGIGIVIGFAVVCLSMYMAVLQRTREIGILKSLGASNGFILRIILTEALMLGIGGTVLGIIMSYGAYHLIRTVVPASIPMIIVKEWWPIAGGITLVGAILGALYPGLAAARHDPIEALAYE
jgi:putative ABC transport system permease protein